jgi:aldose 1-epimerase
MTMSQVVFGEKDGMPIYEVTLKSQAGAVARIMSWGATVRDLIVPSANGPQRVVLGFESFEPYLSHASHAGAIAGRVANRIHKGQFTLDGKDYVLPQNEGENSLHGGGHGFGKRNWQIAWHDETAVALTLFSPDGDAGFPGNMTVSCVYRLLEPATLRVELTAVSDAATLVNLVHHSYFNLDGSADILNHEVMIEADHYVPVDAHLIPHGEVLTVSGTRYDFRHLKRLCPAGEKPVSYDTTYLLRGEAGTLRHAARLRSPVNGLQMDTYTTEPALQLYDGAKLNAPVTGHAGKHHHAFAGICFEPEACPDAVHHPHFPSTRLDPDRIYRQITEYRFH